MGVEVKSGGEGVADRGCNDGCGCRDQEWTTGNQMSH